MGLQSHPFRKGFLTGANLHLLICVCGIVGGGKVFHRELSAGYQLSASPDPKVFLPMDHDFPGISYGAMGAGNGRRWAATADHPRKREEEDQLKARRGLPSSILALTPTALGDAAEQQFSVCH